MVRETLPRPPFAAAPACSSITDVIYKDFGW